MLLNGVWPQLLVNTSDFGFQKQKQSISKLSRPPTPGIHPNIVATSDAQRDKEIALCASQADSQAPLGLRQQEKGTGGWAGMGGREGEG